MKRCWLKIGGLLALGLLPSAAQEAGPLTPRPAGPRYALRAVDNSPSVQASGLRFTLKEAEAYALQNHPQILSASLTADAVRQEIREARSAFFPQVYAESDSVYEPDERTRLAASGDLNSPSLFQHQADGFTATQLITDFGRTYELTESAHFRADAAKARVNVARAMVVLTVDRAYFDVLRARALLRVANDTIHARQIAFNQIATLTKNGLKSTLDSNFAAGESKRGPAAANPGFQRREPGGSRAFHRAGISRRPAFRSRRRADGGPLPSSPEALIQEALNQRPGTEFAAQRDGGVAAFCQGAGCREISQDNRHGRGRNCPRLSRQRALHLHLLCRGCEHPAAGDHGRQSRRAGRSRRISSRGPRRKTWSMPRIRSAATCAWRGSTPTRRRSESP